jgi:hypothetical protein
MGCEGKARVHVVGAETEVIRGPCSSHAAFTHASAGAQIVAQA